MGKTIGIYFSDDLLETLKLRAENAGKRLSPYICEILAAQLSDGPPPLPAPSADKVLQNLVASWNPGQAAKVAAWAEKYQIDQPEFLADLVITLSACARAGANPEELTDALRLVAARARQDNARTEDPPHARAAEPPEKYRTVKKSRKPRRASGDP